MNVHCGQTPPLRPRAANADVFGSSVQFLDMTAGSYREQVRDLLRRRVVQAALERAATQSWERVRMADVAADVGVSRQTLYNEFGSKDALAQALLAQELGSILDGIRSRLDDHQDIQAAVTHALDWAMRETAGHAALQRILSEAREGVSNTFLPLLTTRADAVVIPAADTFESYARKRWPDQLHDDSDPPPRAVIESLVRLLLSHIVLPSGTPEDTAHILAALTAKALTADHGRDREA